ncbi:NADPH:quinone oxidoreductase-like [Prosopis cineraria]|uniref:NADPH:quinone oxidoreductase-like n=1 Tax=Prosopis cineraria TaxID=364024 RepID=UPI0024105898|nr:NADPH:quinone oxidoreductase-like [Prosopis cineraria]
MALSGVTRPTVKVAAICGSLRKGSYNRGLIRSAMVLSRGDIEGIEIEEVDIASLPMLNTDLEKQGTFPAEVEAFRRKILEADSILFASPEYNFSVTAPLKNAMDWGSRPPNVWGGKAAGIVSAGGLLGGARGQFHLRQIGIYIDLHFLNKPEFFLNAFEPPIKFNPDNGDLIDDDARLRLKQLLLSLKDFSLQLQPKS